MPPLGPEDEDIARERERVISGKAQSDILTMIDLSKVQPPYTPQKSNSNCCTLLGLNGSKSEFSKHPAFIEKITHTKHSNYLYEYFC